MLSRDLIDDKNAEAWRYEWDGQPIPSMTREELIAVVVLMYESRRGRRRDDHVARPERQGRSRDLTFVVLAITLFVTSAAKIFMSFFLER